MPRSIDRRAVTALLALAPAFPSRARGASIALMPGSRLTPLADQIYTPPTSLSMVADIYHRMTASVGVDGQGFYPFVVDTGANQSVISEELARRLRLPAGPASPLNGVAGVQMTPTTVATLDVGGVIRSAVTLSVLPASGIGGAGLLGLDGLEQKRLTLDFRGQVLRIEPAGRLWRDSAEIAMKAHRRDGQLTLVDADLAGIPITAFLDSGAQNTIGNLSLRELAIARHPTTRWSPTPIVSATGQTIEAEIADLPNLRFGSLHLPNWPVAFADLHTFRMWDLTSRPAILIGVDVLSRFETVCLDFARNEVRFRLPPSF